MNQATKQALVNAVIMARDFCGDEQAAVIQEAQDLGIRITQSDLAQVMATVNGHWRKFQKAAGVKKKYWRY